MRRNSTTRVYLDSLRKSKNYTLRMRHEEESRAADLPYGRKLGWIENEEEVSQAEADAIK